MSAIRITTLLFPLVLWLAACQTSPDNGLSYAMDPVDVDSRFPPATVELNFKSEGKRLNGHLYQANGAGPHPTVVLLHGYPGNEKNLDLAQAMRRDGFNVLFFHYRGAWGSEGQFSFNNVIEDVGSALAMLRERQQSLRVDASRLILIGHSMGGFAALQGAARDNSVYCVVGLAAANFGGRAEAFQTNTQASQGMTGYGDSLQMLAGWSGKKSVDEIIAHADAFNLNLLASQLSGKSVLLVAADKDQAVGVEQNHLPMVQAYRAQSGIRLTELVLSGDHSFSWTRMRLIDEVINWAQGCK